MTNRLIAKIFGKKKEEEISVAGGLAFLRANGVDTDTLELPRRSPYDLSDEWFEDLMAAPIQRDNETIIKITGRFASQARCGYREDGNIHNRGAMWRPAEPCYYNIDLKIKSGDRKI